MSALQKETVLVAASTENTYKKSLQANHNAKSINKHDQLHRFLLALLKRDLSTYDAQQEAHCSRPSNLATQARKRYGLLLPCRDVRFTTVDGKPSNYGVYYLTKEDRKLLSENGISLDDSGLDA